jgi:hypothetical protein
MAVKILENYIRVDDVMTRRNNSRMVRDSISTHLVVRHTGFSHAMQ